MINPLAMCHALSNIQRYNGHLPDPGWSVGQHSLLVGDIARFLVQSQSDDSLMCCRTEIAALLHDGHEAYVGDITSPLKRLLSGNRQYHIDWEELVIVLDVCIAEAFGLASALGPDVDVIKRLVKKADFLAYRMETLNLRPVCVIDYGDDNTFDYDSLPVGMIVPYQTLKPFAVAAVLHARISSLALELKT